MLSRSLVFIVILAYCLIFNGFISFKPRLAYPKTRLHLSGAFTDVEKTRNFRVLLVPRVRHLDSGTRVKGYFAAGVTRYPNSISTFNVSRLIKCGDIEINPGPDQATSTSRKNPGWKFPCDVCTNPVRINQKGILCDGCNKSVVSSKMYYHGSKDLYQIKFL